MNKALFIAFSIVFSVFSCQKEKKEGSVQLNFTGTFNGAPLVMYQRAYPYLQSTQVKFQLFQFYISEIYLMPDATPGPDDQKLSEIELVTFKDVQDELSAQQGITFSFKDLPAGRYKGIRLGIGVVNNLNSTHPGDYKPGHPLSENYWSAAMGYVFSKIEGTADLDGDGTFSEKLTFHSGANALYLEKNLLKDFEVGDGRITELDFSVDLYKVLVQSSAHYINFNAITQDHTNDINVAKFIIDNIGNALQLK